MFKKKNYNKARDKFLHGFKPALPHLSMQAAPSGVQTAALLSTSQHTYKRGHAAADARLDVTA